MPISQWTPILSANFRMLDWLPATSLNLLPKFETVSIHASDFAPMRTRIGSNSGLMKPRLPSRIILPDWSTLLSPCLMTNSGIEPKKVCEKMGVHESHESPCPRIPQNPPRIPSTNPYESHTKCRQKFQAQITGFSGASPGGSCDREFSSRDRNVPRQ